MTLETEDIEELAVAKIDFNPRKVYSFYPQQNN